MGSQPNERKTMQLIKVLLPSIVTLIIGILIGWRAIPSDPAESEIEWDYPGGSLKINAKKDLNSPEAMLIRLFSTDFSQAGTKKWLKDNYQMFSIEEQSLVDALKDLCSLGPDMKPEERRQQMETCVKIPVISQLRSLAESHEPPFHYIGFKVKIGIPDPEPKEGTANVCLKNPRIPSEFLGKEIELTNPDNNVSITVKATGHYKCTGYNIFPDIQLSLNDARKLFIGQKRQEFENTKVIAVILGG
jgi:hypothetical protein